jgi:hypothetical protein
MRYRFLAGLLATLTMTASLSAGEIQGEFVKYDEITRLLTVAIRGASSTYTLSDDTKVTTQKGESTKLGIKLFSIPRIAKPGASLTIITTKRDGKDIVTQIKLGRNR